MSLAATVNGRQMAPELHAKEGNMDSAEDHTSTLDAARLFGPNTHPRKKKSPVEAGFRGNQGSDDVIRGRRPAPRGAGGYRTTWM